jgi:hypothetical protein
VGERGDAAAQARNQGERRVCARASVTRARGETEGGGTFIVELSDWRVAVAAGVVKREVSKYDATQCNVPAAVQLHGSLVHFSAARAWAAAERCGA